MAIAGEGLLVGGLHAQVGREVRLAKMEEPHPWDVSDLTDAFGARDGLDQCGYRDGLTSAGGALGVAVETGNVTDVVERRESQISGCEVYLCGPPPMVDAALALLDASNVPKDQVFYDKFTSPATA